MTLPRNGDATISTCGRYRYRLDRIWDERPACCFVMLNPSTADATEDDPTIRRCVGFARHLNSGRLIVVNLFAWRATDPKNLRNVADPIGPENNRYLRAAFDEADVTIAAWGTQGHFHARNRTVMNMLAGRGFCLGLTAKGDPKHPLYLPKDAPLVRLP